MQTTVCPKPVLLSAFQQGNLTGQPFEALAAHIVDCAACQRWLDEHEADIKDDLLLARLHSLKTAETPPQVPGYELLEMVGKGGMGIVYRARDVRLKREVAVKLLQERYAENQVAVERFRGEATVTGQLQHPCIPAVHEVGTLANGRPFLAMKLVKGQTLHDLLKKNNHSAPDHGRFLAIFEQVCHALGYAHARGVIHRDLKPLNVMVGAHGEVQVMDWGLAKVLDDVDTPRAPMPHDSRTAPPALTEIDTPPRDATLTGSLLGTPAYMSPEQAAGEIRKLDPRSDVFGLGAILCQILTGRPPYSGADAKDVRLQAVRGELSEAFAALDASAADPDFVALCKRCLAFNRGDRPMDGTAVAQEVIRIRQAAEERARRAELGRAEALVREAEHRQRRRLWFGLAASLLVGVLALSGIAVIVVVSNQNLASANAALKNEQEKTQVLLAKETELNHELITERNKAVAERARAEDALKKVMDTDTAGKFFLQLVDLMVRVTNNPADTEQPLRLLLPHFRSRAEQFPQSSQYQRDLAFASHWLGRCLQEQGKLTDEIERLYLESNACFDRVISNVPNDNESRMIRANNFNNLAMYYSSLKAPRWDKAELAIDQAIEQLTILTKQFPEALAYSGFLGNALNTKASLFIKQDKNWTVARDLLRQAIEYERVAIKMESQFGNFLYLQYVNLFDTSLRLNYHEAADEGQKIFSDPIADNRLRYLAAQTIAACADKARHDEAIAKAMRDEVVERYASKAVRMLTDLHRQGAFTAPAERRLFLEDKSFAHLTSRADFQELLKQLQHQ